jgi:hypothetical protein
MAIKVIPAAPELEDAADAGLRHRLSALGHVGG